MTISRFMPRIFQNRNEIVDKIHLRKAYTDLVQFCSIILILLALRAASQPKCEAPLRNEVNQKRTNVRPLLSLLGSFGAIEWLSWAFFCHLHDHHKRGHLFSHGLGVSMPRPFRKGIACHGSMQACPFCYYGICCFIIW